MTVFLAVALRGEVTWRFIREVSHETASTTGMVIWIVFGATAFASVYSAGGGIAFMRALLLASEIPP